MPYTIESIPETEKKKKRVTAQLVVKGRAIRCPMCGHEWFWERNVLLNSRGLTFAGLDWADKGARGLICDDCGHVLLFAR